MLPADLVAEMKKLANESYDQGRYDAVLTFVELADAFGAVIALRAMRTFLRENPSPRKGQ